MKRQVEECVELSVPGPHAFLLVIQVGRFTQEEQDAVTFIEKNFGKNALKYTIVLFSHVDQLKKKPLKEYVKETQGLRELIRRCGNRYHSFNNENVENRLQVTQLLQMIRSMVNENGETYYTNKMFQKAQRDVKFEERYYKAKDAASVAGLVVSGAVLVGGVCAGGGAAVGAAIGAVALAEAAAGAIGVGIGAGIVGGVAGGVAGGVIGAKPEETFEMIKNKKKD